MDVNQLREQIPTCQKMIYMNTGWSGPSPISVVDAIKERLDVEMNDGPVSFEVNESGKEITVRARAAVAELLHVSPEEVCLTSNTTDGLNTVMNGLPWKAGDEIITCTLEHSSVLIPSYFQRQRHGIVVKVLPIAPNEGADGVLEQIAAGISDRTRMVFLSHVEYSCGMRMPVKEIRELTKGKGIWMLLDGAQTAGHIALDMYDIGCDFYSIAGQKWLLGPEGTGALYIRKDMIPQVEPIKVAGRAVLSHDDPYEFEPNTTSMDKFLITSTSAPLRAGMLETIRFIQDIGLEQIETHNLSLASSLKVALLETPGVEVLSPLESRASSGLVSFTIRGVEPDHAVSHLWEHHQIVARQVAYPLCIRVSLHFFNTEEEVNSVVKAVRELAR